MFGDGFPNSLFFFKLGPLYPSTTQPNTKRPGPSFPLLGGALPPTKKAPLSGQADLAGTLPQMLY